MTAIFIPEGNLFRATEHAGGPWSPDMLQGSATTALMVREVERLAAKPGFAVRRLTFDLSRPAGLRAFGLETDMLRDGRKAKTIQVRLIEGALEKPGPAAAWLRLDTPLVDGEANTPLLQAVQAADFSSGVAQIVDMREWVYQSREGRRGCRQRGAIARIRTAVRSSAGKNVSTASSDSVISTGVPKIIVVEKKLRTSPSSRILKGIATLSEDSGAARAGNGEAYSS
jgi:hypothetical protein